MKRAAICIGIGKALPAAPLKGAAAEARRFAAWAKSQGCDTTLLVDEQDSVSLAHVFTAVAAVIERGVHQLIVYFAGHGMAPDLYAERWLLSGARHNDTEGVNLRRSIDYARCSGIPHVVFVSDACRTHTANELQGGSIFPKDDRGEDTEVDVYYATRPGGPAFEVGTGVNATGIFTHVLLRTVLSPDTSLIDTFAQRGVTHRVITSRKLKPYLEQTVPLVAGAIDIKLSRYPPQLLVETALPKFFARVDAPAPPLDLPPLPPPPRGSGEPTIHEALDELADAACGYGVASSSLDAAKKAGLAQEVETLAAAQRHALFDTDTGISVHGAVPKRVKAGEWNAAEPIQGAAGFHHVVLRSRSGIEGIDSAVIEFTGGGGTVVAIVPQYICAIVVRDERVVSVHYAPSPNSPIAEAYREVDVDVDRLRAIVAVAARNGRLIVPPADAPILEGRIRPDTAFDPTLGLYAAYAYAAAGRYSDVYTILHDMRDQPPHFVPFDVLMLAAASPHASVRDQQLRGFDLDHRRHPPGIPMLSQGWTVLDDTNRLWDPDLHMRMRRQLTPSLWTTLSSSGVSTARELVFAVATEPA